MEILPILTQFGLSEKEAAVYMATMELGGAPTSVIAKRAGLTRPTVHEILKSLCSQGLAQRFMKNKIRYYSTISPRQFYEQCNQRLMEFQGLLPQMMAMYNTMSNKPKITFFEGKKDLERLYTDVVYYAKDEALNYFRPNECFKYFGQNWSTTNHIDERVKRGIRLRVIMPECEYVQEYKEKSPKQLRTFKVIASPSIQFNTEVYIYEDRMSMISYEHAFGLLIESKDVVQTQRSMFELAWNSSLLRDP